MRKATISATTIAALVSSVAAAQGAGEQNYFSPKIIGFVQADSVFSLDDSVNHPSGTEIPKARLGVKGKLSNDLGYTLDFEFGKGASGSINDAYLSYKVNENLTLDLGQRRDQANLEFISTIKHRAFPDRAFNAVLVPGRQFGLTAIYAGSNYATTLQVSGEGVQQKRANNEGYSASGRFSYAPILNASSVLHVGGSFTWVKPEEQSKSVSYKARHESSLAQLSVADTGSITDVDSSNIYNADIFAKAGPFWVMSEYTRNTAKRIGALDDLSFNAWYAQAGWVLVGENRSYSPVTGVGGISPKVSVSDGGPGAVELAVRYDTIDLNDGTVLGGEVDRYSIAASWYPIKKFQLRAAFQIADTKNAASIPADKPKAIILRAVWSM